MVSPKNQKVRVELANTHRYWTINDWKRVLWSDEPKYNLKGPDGKLKVRRPKDKRLDPRYTRGTLKHGDEKGAMVLGSLPGFNGIGPIHQINGIMDR